MLPQAFLRLRLLGQSSNAKPFNANLGHGLGFRVGTVSGLGFGFLVTSYHKDPTVGLHTHDPQRLPRSDPAIIDYDLLVLSGFL